MVGRVHGETDEAREGDNVTLVTLRVRIGDEVVGSHRGPCAPVASCRPHRLSETQDSLLLRWVVSLVTGLVP